MHGRLILNEDFPCRSVMHEAKSTGLCVGFDIVQIAQMTTSLTHFGDAFTHRLFTRDELNYATQDVGLCAERLAARFAAKEAVIKALQLSEVGVDWRQIEVIKLPLGRCCLQMHGLVAQLASDYGVTQWLLSMSHDGDYAGAIVIALGFARHR